MWPSLTGNEKRLLRPPLAILHHCHYTEPRSEKDQYSSSRAFLEKKMKETGDLFLLSSLSNALKAYCTFFTLKVLTPILP